MSKRFLAVVTVLFLFGLGLPAQRPVVLRPTVFAIRDARVVTEPGQVLPKATVVIRDGLIEAVGPDAKVPADALVIDGQGLTVYPGFIDAASGWGYDPALRRSESGPPAPDDFASEALAATKTDNRKGITPEFLVQTALKAEEEQAESWRKIGFTSHLIAPDNSYIAGQSALVSLSGAAPREAVLRSPVAMHVSLRTQGGNDYPRSLMGVFAHCRQTLLDAGHYQRAWNAFEKNGGVGKRPPVDPALAELGKVLDRRVPVIFEADTKDEIHRALDFAEEFKLQPIIYGGLHAWKVADRLKEKKVPVLLRLNFAERTPPKHGHHKKEKSDPDKEADQEKEKEKEKESKLPQRVQEDQQREFKEEVRNALILHQHGIDFAFSTHGQPPEKDKGAEKFRENLNKVVTEGLPPEAALKALTLNAARILDAEKQIGSIAVGKAAHLVVTDGDFHEAKTRICYTFSDGVRFEYAKPRFADKDGDKKEDKKEDKEEKKPDEKKPDEKNAKREAAPDLPTELESDRKPKVQTGGNVLIRGATVLTVTKGTHPKTDILVRNGKIEKIGANLDAPEGVKVIDATGMFVMPGIIDTHSHFSMSGGVNEFSLSIVPETRARDTIDSEDVQIYRGLAGGVTTARLLHGSANVIGGQDAVIKMKYGQPASKLLVADAPRGVKFALGENVKRTGGRFPNTRLGVEALLIRAFTEAQAYRKTWEDYEKAKAAGKPAIEPRRDLRLEALVDILKGDLKVHCHCYRADEILMLLRVADRFGFKVKSLQHVLEGYKVAPEIAEHGASNSTFSDWWAYKIEAYDAIPFNSMLLHEAGAEVCLKSDSHELMRHMYQEAAKCIKYGGMSETDALKTITFNPAKQLSLDKRIGSIEAGKDADLAIFNGHPLNSYARVEMTLVEGEVYFQRSEKLTPSAIATAGPSVPRNGFKLPQRNGNGNGTIVIKGATVHPATGPAIPDAIVVIEKGKIAHVGQKIGKEDLSKATVIEAKDMHLYPGMIDTATVLGLTELGSARETHDYAEGGDFQPDLRASTAIHPDSELIPVTRANGVTTAVTRPTGSVIAGQSALIDLAGWVPKEMVVVDPLALHIEFPAALPIVTGHPALGRAITKKQREEKIRRLKELFKMALAHDEARKQDPAKPANPRLDALVPYARGEKLIVIQANRKDEITEALQLADELKLKVVISGATEAWKVADELKKRKVPVVIGPTMTMPQESHDPYDSPFTCAAKLHEAGVRFCIRSAGDSNARNLPYEAAMAVSYGLPPEEGLKAITLYPAEIFGVADQMGSITEGKRANLVLTNGDILQASTQVQALFIDGRPLEPTSKQTRLYERYRERLREVKNGQAPLGTK